MENLSKWNWTPELQPQWSQSINGNNYLGTQYHWTLLFWTTTSRLCRTPIRSSRASYNWGNLWAAKGQSSTGCNRWNTASSIVWPKLVTFIKLNWFTLHNLQGDKALIILAKYSNLFHQGIGMINGYQADMQLGTDIKSIFKESCPVTYALQSALGKEL